MTPSKSTPLRAVGYIRVSTVGQVQETESLATQRSLIEAHAQAHEWRLLKIFEDAGISGAKNDRPALQALLQAAGRKEFDVVVVRDLSRFGRSTRDLLNNVEVLIQENGIRFVAIKEGLNPDNMYGKFMLQVLSAIAELERKMIEERMNESKMVQWKEKRIFNGSLPLGYTWNKTSQAIEILPEEAAVYRRIVDEYLDLGKSVKDIVLGLQKDHIPTRLKGRWAGPTLCQLLRNTAYYGLLVVNVNQPAAEHITFEAPPLISKARWDSLQERLNSSRQRAGRPSIGGGQEPSQNRRF